MKITITGNFPQIKNAIDFVASIVENANGVFEGVSQDMRMNFDHEEDGTSIVIEKYEH